MRLIMGVLLVGVDLGVFFYVESRRRERRMKELEAENTKQRLESLRYQINPHFFMNTLNNIHALVDIDPDKAKESIEEFSKM
ncbi:MAG: histidine kinase, partial [Bacteroidales bacterium]|nr:histidine kinase [Bacteroidales bacterium]